MAHTNLYGRNGLENERNHKWSYQWNYIRDSFFNNYCSPFSTIPMDREPVMKIEVKNKSRKQYIKVIITPEPAFRYEEK